MRHPEQAAIEREANASMQPYLTAYFAKFSKSTSPGARAQLTRQRSAVLQFCMFLAEQGIVFPPQENE